MIVMCGHCHECGNQLSIEFVGKENHIEEYCSICNKYFNYRSHGFISGEGSQYCPDEVLVKIAKRPGAQTIGDFRILGLSSMNDSDIVKAISEFDLIIIENRISGFLIERANIILRPTTNVAHGTIVIKESGETMNFVFTDIFSRFKGEWTRGWVRVDNVSQRIAFQLNNTHVLSQVTDAINEQLSNYEKSSQIADAIDTELSKFEYLVLADGSTYARIFNSRKVTTK